MTHGKLRRPRFIKRKLDQHNHPEVDEDDKVLALAC